MHFHNPWTKIFKKTIFFNNLIIKLFHVTFTYRGNIYIKIHNKNVHKSNKIVFLIYLFDYTRNFVSLFNDISTFMDYLIPKQSLLASRDTI